jgi:hypothetical protein
LDEAYQEETDAYVVGEIEGALDISRGLRKK